MTEQNKQQTDTDIDRQRSPWRVVTAALIVVAATVAGWATWLAPADLPQIDFTDCHPSVRGAIEECVANVADAPRSAETWGQLGMTLRAHEFDAAAIDCFRESIRRNPDDFRWPYYLATTLETIDVVEAEKAYRAAHQCKPDEKLALIRLAELLQRQSRIDECSKLLDEAVGIDSGFDHVDPRIRFRFAQIDLQRGSAERALMSAEDTWGYVRNNRHVIELLAQLYAITGDEGSARQFRDKANEPGTVTGWPDPWLEAIDNLRRDPHRLFARANQAIAAGRIDEGISLLRQVVGGNPDNWMFATRLARVYLERNDAKTSARVLDDALQRHPQTFDLHGLRGAIYLLEEDWLSAKRHLGRAVELKPDAVSARMDLGFCLEQLDEDTKALEQYAAGLSLDPESMQLHLAIGRLLLSLRKTEEAHQHLRKCVDDPRVGQDARKLLGEIGESDTS